MTRRRLLWEILFIIFILAAFCFSLIFLMEAAAAFAYLIYTLDFPLFLRIFYPIFFISRVIISAFFLIYFTYLCCHLAITLKEKEPPYDRPKSKPPRCTLRGRSSPL